MKIIFAGTIGRSGLGGQAWAGLQYLLGLRALGHEVVYLEDCGKSSWVYIWEKEDWTHELDYPAAYVRACLEPFGLGDSWIYRDNYRSLGMPLEAFQQFCANADLLILRAVPFWNWRPEYDQPRRRVFIDVDPGFTQATLASGDQGWIEGVARCERRFTYGLAFGRDDCLIPDVGGPWHATRPPVHLPDWPDRSGTAGSGCYTSVIRWQGFKDVTVNGRTFGQRDKKFAEFLDLPRRTSIRFLIAMMGTKPSTLEDHGWGVAPGEVISRTPESYRQFIGESRGELCIPKEGYVAMNTGWISDRSVCYLASGRPVLMAETGVSQLLPTVAGLMTFANAAQAADAIARVEADYPAHARAARALAELEFSTAVVLPGFLDAASQ